MNKLLYFVFGLCLGGGAAYFGTSAYLTKKYREQMKIEVDSIKESFGINFKKKDPEPEEKEEKPQNDIHEPATDKDIISMAAEYQKAIEVNNYSSYSNTETQNTEILSETDIYAIPQEESGENGYRLVEVNLYSNGVLTDSFDEVIEEPEVFVGKHLVNNPKHPKDTVYIRNEETMCDYEVNIMMEPYEDD